LDHESNSRSVLSIEVGINLRKKEKKKNKPPRPSSITDLPLPHQTDRTELDRISEWQKLQIFEHSHRHHKR
jgi:hypothetical protein